MPELSVPAPLWRRLMASVYDGLLLLGLWMSTALINVLIRQALHLDDGSRAPQVLFFLVGLVFFGWFWTHGGQTLGMRAWRLRVQRCDGNALRWPIAIIRYSVMLASWLAVPAPFVLGMPRFAAHAHAALSVPLTATLVTIGVIFALLDSRRRAPCDLAAGTEVLVLPKP